MPAALGVLPHTQGTGGDRERGEVEGERATLGMLPHKQGVCGGGLGFALLACVFTWGGMGEGEGRKVLQPWLYSPMRCASRLVQDVWGGGVGGGVAVLATFRSHSF